MCTRVALGIEMNLEGVLYSKHRILNPKVIPLLGVIKQWSSQRQDEAMMDTPCILFILQTLQSLLSKHESVSFIT